MDVVDCIELLVATLLFLNTLIVIRNVNTLMAGNKSVFLGLARRRSRTRPPAILAQDKPGIGLISRFLRETSSLLSGQAMTASLVRLGRGLKPYCCAMVSTAFFDETNVAANGSIGSGKLKFDFVTTFFVFFMFRRKKVMQQKETTMAAQKAMDE